MACAATRATFSFNLSQRPQLPSPKSRTHISKISFLSIHKPQKTHFFSLHSIDVSKEDKTPTLSDSSLTNPPAEPPGTEHIDAETIENHLCHLIQRVSKHHTEGGSSKLFPSRKQLQVNFSHTARITSQIKSTGRSSCREQNASSIENRFYRIELHPGQIYHPQHVDNVSESSRFKTQRKKTRCCNFQ